MPIVEYFFMNIEKIRLNCIFALWKGVQIYVYNAYSYCYYNIHLNVFSMDKTSSSVL